MEKSNVFIFDFEQYFDYFLFQNEKRILFAQTKNYPNGIYFHVMEKNHFEFN